MMSSMTGGILRREKMQMIILHNIMLLKMCIRDRIRTEETILVCHKGTDVKGDQEEIFPVKAGDRVERAEPAADDGGTVFDFLENVRKVDREFPDLLSVGICVMAFVHGSHQFSDDNTGGQ